MILSRWILPRIRNVSGKSCREHFSKIVPFMRYCGKIWQNQTGHRWQDGASVLHAGYLRLHTSIHTHTHTLSLSLSLSPSPISLSVCDTYCFSTETMVISVCVHCYYSFFRPVYKHSNIECPGLGLQNHIWSAWISLTLFSPLSNKILNQSVSINVLFTKYNKRKFSVDRNYLHIRLKFITWLHVSTHCESSSGQRT
jgi:hypothetical protein